jgi:dTDP-4-amino-4,6-dideoxygalactose transaminase
MARRILFNQPGTVGRELDYIRDAIDRQQAGGGGHYGALAARFIEAALGRGRVLLTPSATAALDMAAILLEVGPGDEVIMPSWTFPSTANAFALRGAVPVFVDVRRDTLNLDERLVEAAVTQRTRAISVVHYAGVGADMAAIAAIAARHRLAVIEDAAHGWGASRDGRALGTFGRFAAFSFHRTKPVQCGEGGALVLNHPTDIARAEMVWEKGTSRLAFERGETDAYAWTDLGSSFVAGELPAAFLLAQLEHGAATIAVRLALWHRYHQGLADLDAAGRLTLPASPQGHNACIFHLLAASAAARTGILRRLAAAGIAAPVHYTPLHAAPAGRRLGRVAATMPVTEDVAARLFRLPLHLHLSEDDQDRVIAAVRAAVTATEPEAGLADAAAAAPGRRGVGFCPPPVR